MMAEKYSVEMHVSASPQSWFGIENVFKKANNCTCLYVSYFQNHPHWWILKISGVLLYQRISVEENLVQAGLPKDLSLGEYLADNFWSLGILPIDDCEDRSLNTVAGIAISLPERKTSARLRLVEEDEDDGCISSLSLCYKMFFFPRL